MLKLRSNFLDYYDHQFDLSGEEFRRMSNEGMNRIEMLDFMKSKRLIVPPYGVVRQLKHHAYITPEAFVVVHLDINSHRGENKLLMRYREALEQYPDAFMVMYASSFTGVSWRYLKVGSRSFILRYEGDDWRSNWNTKNIIVESDDASWIKIDITAPLFAIDFVKNERLDGENVMVAIDFNIAPQIKGSGIEDILSATEVVKLIRDAVEKESHSR